MAALKRVWTSITEAIKGIRAWWHWDDTTPRDDPPKQP
jgi:hypothetical protein